MGWARHRALRPSGGAVAVLSRPSSGLQPPPGQRCTRTGIELGSRWASADRSTAGPLGSVRASEDCGWH